MAKANNKLKKPLTDGGYQPKFLGTAFHIKFPELNAAQKADLVKFQQGKFRLDFIHYSVVMSKSRRLAYFSAVNIDGTNWQDNGRKGTWQTPKQLEGTTVRPPQAKGKALTAAAPPVRTLKVKIKGLVL